MNKENGNAAEVTKEQYEKAVADYNEYFTNDTKVLEIREMFAQLGDYEDSAKYLAKCENIIAHFVGKVISFGNRNGKEILWKSIKKDGNRYLLLAEHPVEYMHFHVERDNTPWSNCALRRWLNKQFLEEAFTFQERMTITMTLHKNNIDPRWGDENGPDTKDKAFVFNLKELNELLPTQEERNIGEWWWLRGHGCNNLNQQVVYKDGTVYENGISSNSPDVGVRPAMWVRINK